MNILVGILAIIFGADLAFGDYTADIRLFGVLGIIAGIGVLFVD